MFEKDFHTPTNIPLLEAIVVIAACFAPCVVHMESISSEMKAFGQKAEKLLSILPIERVKYLVPEVIDERGKETIVFDAPKLISCKNTNASRPFQFLM